MPILSQGRAFSLFMFDNNPNSRRSERVKSFLFSQDFFHGVDDAVNVVFFRVVAHQADTDDFSG